MGATSLTALADTVRTGLADLAAAQRDDADKDALRRAATRLADCHHRLQAADACRRALREEGVVVASLSALETSACGKARTAVRRARTQLLAGAGSHLTLLNSPSLDAAYGTADRTAKVLVDKVNAALSAEQRRLSPSDLAQPIPDVPGHGGTHVQLQRARHTLTRPPGLTVESVAEAGAEATKAFLRAVRDAAEAWTRLRPQLDARLASEHPDVQCFLQAVGTPGGAPLALVTPEVRAWLHAHELEDAYAVKPSDA